MAVLSGGPNCLRVLTIIFNFFVFLCGLTVVGFSSYLLYTLNSTFTSMRPQEYGVVVGFLPIGFIICILGFLGCCGAWKESVCMLTAVRFIIAILLILDLVLVVLGFIYKDKLPELIETFLQNELVNSKNGNSVIMDNVQTAFACCGVLGPSDYDKSIPSSCENYDQGCLGKMEDIFMRFSTILLIFAIVVAIFQLAAIIVACYLRSSIRSYQAV
ncbi:cd63 antigen [Echinococcus multilocularis]|uniref:Tetraspanin n=1 Tax=Echinococcus multilocularis TaxID=6211 RepID=A0A068YHU6_ECHMU|nr:cd63 antigen [Echinococcus multilocularis]